MASIQCMDRDRGYTGYSGCVINYPPPGSIGKNGSPYPNPFENHVASPFCPIRRSIGVNGCETDEDEDEKAEENPQVLVPQASIQDVPTVNALDLELPPLTRQESVVENEDCGAGDGDDDEYVYICLRCPSKGVCISCGHEAN